MAKVKKNNDEIIQSEETVVTVETSGTTEEPMEKPITKRVWNISNSKLELEIGGKALSISPRQTVEIPIDFVIPQNIGLVER